MNQNYGAGQQSYGQAPYSSQQDSGFAGNPQYKGQAGGIQPLGNDGRGPAEESRYGAMPLSTGTGMHQGHQGQDPMEAIRNPAAYGFKKDEPQGFRYPGPHQGHAGGFNNNQQNLVDPNARPSEAGYGSSQPGYGQHQGFQGAQMGNQSSGDDFAKPQPGYGQPGFGAPSQGHHTSNLWPSPATPPNPHRSDLVGQDQQQHHHHQQHQQPYGTDGAPWQAGGVEGYDNNNAGPRKETLGEKIKDKVGMGQRRDTDGPYGSHPADATHGPYTGSERQGLDYNPNSSHPSEVRGFGGGLGHPHEHKTGYDQSSQLGSGYDDKRMPTGADAYEQGNQGRMTGLNEPPIMGEHRVEPGYDGSKGHQTSYEGGGARKETLGEKMKDKVGMGHHDNTTSADYPPASNTGYHSHETMGEKVKDSVGMGHHAPLATEHPHRDTTTGAYDETHGKGFEDKTGAGQYDTKTSEYPHQDTSTTTGTGAYGDTGADYPHQDPSAHPPKKGIITKIKEKLKH